MSHRRSCIRACERFSRQGRKNRRDWQDARFDLRETRRFMTALQDRPDIFNLLSRSFRDCVADTSIGLISMSLRAELYPSPGHPLRLARDRASNKSEPRLMFAMCMVYGLLQIFACYGGADGNWSRGSEVNGASTIPGANARRVRQARGSGMHLAQIACHKLVEGPGPFPRSASQPLTGVRGSFESGRNQWVQVSMKNRLTIGARRWCRAF